MAARRLATYDDQVVPPDEVFDDPASDPWDLAGHTPEGPLHVCLGCGASPPVGPGCDHRITARLEHPSGDVVLAAQRLAAAARAFREGERALKRLVDRERELGRAETITRPDPPARPVTHRPPALAAASPSQPCPRCGYPNAPLTSNRATRRQGGRTPGQTLLAFADATASHGGDLQAPTGDPSRADERVEREASTEASTEASAGAPSAAGERAALEAPYQASSPSGERALPEDPGGASVAANVGADSKAWDGESAPTDEARSAECGRAERAGDWSPTGTTPPRDAAAGGQTPDVSSTALAGAPHPEGPSLARDDGPLWAARAPNLAPVDQPTSSAVAGRKEPPPAHEPATNAAPPLAILGAAPNPLAGGEGSAEYMSDAWIDEQLFGTSFVTGAARSNPFSGSARDEPATPPARSPVVATPDAPNRRGDDAPPAAGPSHRPQPAAEAVPTGKPRRRRARASHDEGGGA
jgi:hypothetical protein